MSPRKYAFDITPERRRGIALSAGEGRRLEQARRSLHLVLSAPADAERLASEVVEADGPAASTAGALARWAIGKAAIELGEPDRALAVLEEAGRVAGASGEPVLEGQIALSIALAAVTVGDPQRASNELDRAERLLAGEHHAALCQQRGYVAYLLGQPAVAIEWSDAALRALDTHGAAAAQARVLANRAIARIAVGDLGGADTDLERCIEAASTADQDLIVAAAHHNRACVQARCGDLPRALRSFETARTRYAALADPGRVMITLDTDQSDALLAAGLAGDAVNYARRAVNGAAAGGDTLQESDATLRLASALLSAGHHDEAGVAARAAWRLSRRTAQAHTAILAEYVAAEASLADTDHHAPRSRDESQPGHALLDRAADMATALDAAGWRHEARSLRVSAARRAALEGRHELARQLLAAIGPPRSSALDMLGELRARALTAWLDGDAAGALRAARRGLAYLSAYRRHIGSTELRVSAGQLAGELVDLGLRHTIERRRPSQVVAWSEQLRASSPTAASAQPDPLVARPREAVGDRHDVDGRRLAARHRSLAAAAAYRPGGGTGDDAALRRAERELIEHARRSFADATDDQRVHAALSVALGDAMLASYVACDGRYHVATLAAGQWRLHQLGLVADVAGELDHLLSGVRMATVDGASERAQRRIERAASRIESLVLPSRLRRSRRRVVVVPSGRLFGIPWGVLPAMRERPHVVAPSVHAWRSADARRSESRGQRLTIVVGPELPSADDELRRLRAVDPSLVALTDTDATVAAALVGLSGSRIVHLAAHGSFRRDSPLLSSFRLADGPLTLFDLERTGAQPDVVVMPSCEAAAHFVHDGDAAIGTGTALLGRGARTVIAPLERVLDAAVPGPMSELHHRLRRGERVDDALAAIRTSASLDAVERLAATQFVCLGSGAEVDDVADVVRRR